MWSPLKSRRMARGRREWNVVTVTTVCSHKPDSSLSPSPALPSLRALTCVCAPCPSGASHVLGAMGTAPHALKFLARRLRRVLGWGACGEGAGKRGWGARGRGRHGNIAVRTFASRAIIAECERFCGASRPQTAGPPRSLRSPHGDDAPSPRSRHGARALRSRARCRAPCHLLDGAADGRGGKAGGGAADAGRRRGDIPRAAPADEG